MEVLNRQHAPATEAGRTEDEPGLEAGTLLHGEVSDANNEHYVEMRRRLHFFGFSTWILGKPCLQFVCSTLFDVYVRFAQRLRCINSCVADLWTKLRSQDKLVKLLSILLKMGHGC